MRRFTLHHGNCLEVLRTLESESVDSCVTDPPYDLTAVSRGGSPRVKGSGPFGRHTLETKGFMGMAWDGTGIAFNPELWAEVLRVLKPGAHLLAFGGTRTYHRMAVAIEDAGFEIRDQIQWLYGSGFPKSLDVSKAIDRQAGAERETIGVKNAGSGNRRGEGYRHNGDVDGLPVTVPATDQAKQWEGWGTALKPAHEPICVARKPLSEPTVADNVLKHGTGAINIDGCRIEAIDSQLAEKYASVRNAPPRNNRIFGSDERARSEGRLEPHEAGRWPSNVILDEEAGAVLDRQSGQIKTQRTEKPCPNPEIRGHKWGTLQGDRGARGYSDDGGASRFFYCPKVDRVERNAGLFGLAEKMPDNAIDRATQRDGQERASGRGSLSKPRANYHPTVKPVDLMQYLCRLVTPPGGIVLDPFMGSGSTGIAALAEGFTFTGIELDAEYLEIARCRIKGDAPLFNEELSA